MITSAARIALRPSAASRSGESTSVSGVGADEEADEHEAGISASATWSALFRIRLTARSALFWIATPDAHDVFDGIARDGHDHEARELLRDAQLCHGRLQRIDEPVRHERGADGGDHQVGHGEAEWPGMLDRHFQRARAFAAADRERDRDDEHGQQHDGADHGEIDRVPDIGLARLRGDGRDRQCRDGQDQQRRDHAGRPGLEMLRPVLQATEQEGETQDEQGVREDRTDEGRLDDQDQAGLQREDADEELGQVAEARLQHAGRARPQAMAQLIRALADHRGEPRQRDARQDEDDNRIEVGRPARRIVASVAMKATAITITARRPSVVPSVERASTGRILAGPGRVGGVGGAVPAGSAMWMSARPRSRPPARW